MNKYEQFDISTSRLKEIEKELSDLINKDNPPLGVKRSAKLGS